MTAAPGGREKEVIPYELACIILARATKGIGLRASLRKIGCVNQEWSTSMQRLIFASVGIFTMLFCLASPALADDGFSIPVFASQMICDTDGTIQTPFTDVKGIVTIFNNGDLLINIPSGLKPNTAYTVRLLCGAFGAPDASRSTNSRGRLLALIPGLGRSGDLAPGCGLPVVTAFTDDPAGGDFCQTGYGLD